MINQKEKFSRICKSKDDAASFLASQTAPSFSSLSAWQKEIDHSLNTTLWMVLTIAQMDSRNKLSKEILESDPIITSLKPLSQAKLMALRIAKCYP